MMPLYILLMMSLMLNDEVSCFKICC